MPEKNTWANVWDEDLLEGLLIALQITEAVDKGVHLVLLILLSAIQDEVRRKKHKVSKLVSLGAITFQGEVKHEPSESTTGV